VSQNSYAVLALAFLASYLVGSIPCAYIIVRLVTGEDITAHGTGNVGAMNVRRSTGSWAWFTVAMASDALKGMLPTFAAKLLVMSGGALLALTPWSVYLAEQPTAWWTVPALMVPMIAVAGVVVGHNYSAWMALLKRRFARTGKGLATGGGALLIYDWRYFIAVVVVGLTVIAITRYMMAGQVAAAITLPVTAIVLRSPDWPFALLMGAFVYAAHHRRFIGMLKGREPKLYINDRMGPTG